jgi:hypothetical protein
MTPAMTDLERFFDYVRAFELAHATDDWASLLPSFAPDAWHVVHHGGPLGGTDRGREAVVGGLRASVHGADRRFTTRIAEIVAGPEVRPDGVWMRFALELRHDGTPGLRIEGDHRVAFQGGLITEIEETLPPGTGERAAAFFAEHDGRLRPAGAPPAFPTAAHDQRWVLEALQRSIVRCYGGAKSRADVGAALALCRDDFRLEAVSLGTTSHGRAETARHLAHFFGAFPDYGVRLDGFALGDGVVTCWGTARMTLTGEWLGHPPTGRTAELPCFCVFEMDGVQLCSERFFFDLASLCEQIGVPLDGVRATLAAVRSGGVQPAVSA